MTACATCVILISLSLSLSLSLCLIVVLLVILRFVHLFGRDSPLVGRRRRLDGSVLSFFSFFLFFFLETRRSFKFRFFSSASSSSAMAARFFSFKFPHFSFPLPFSSNRRILRFVAVIAVAHLHIGVQLCLQRRPSSFG